MPAGAVIDVSLHWAKWLPATGLVGAMTFMAAIGVVAGAGLPFTIGALVVFAALTGAVVWPAIFALRNGFLVRLDAAGIHARGQVIPWREVQAVDVETSRLRVACRNGREVAIPLFFARFDPDSLPQTVRVSSQLWRACHG